MGTGAAMEICLWQGAEPQACTPGPYLGEGSEQAQDGAGVCGGEDGEHGEREPLICFLAAPAASFHHDLSMPTSAQQPFQPLLCQGLFLLSTCFKGNLL